LLKKGKRGAIFEDSLLSKLYIDVNKFTIEKIIKKETGRIMDSFGLPILSCSDLNLSKHGKQLIVYKESVPMPSSKPRL